MLEAFNAARLFPVPVSILKRDAFYSSLAPNWQMPYLTLRINSARDHRARGAKR
jgi:hypothetical protein